MTPPRGTFTLFFVLSGVLILAAVLAIVITLPVVQAIAIGCASAAIVALIQIAVTNRGGIKLWLQLAWHRPAYVRFSVSYLARIVKNERYLLVRGQRYRDQFQPVGGVYKAVAGGAVQLQRLDCVPDALTPHDEISHLDLRFRVPWRNVLKTLKFLNENLGIELGPQREFYEELIGTGHLASTTFPYVLASRRRRHVHPLRYSDFAACHELLVADIVDIEVDDDQWAEIEAAVQARPDELMLATVNQIERLGAVPGMAHERTIALTAQWLL